MATNNPFRGFTDTLSESNRAQQEWMGAPSPGRVQQQGSSQEDAWIPAVEVIAEDGDLVILMDLPGVKPEEVELAFSGGLFTISGDRKERQTGSEHYTRERPLGRLPPQPDLPYRRKRGKHTGEPRKRGA